MAKMVIEVRKLEGLRPGWIARIKQRGRVEISYELADLYGYKGIGDSPAEAIGHLINLHSKLFDVEIVNKEVFDKS
jgi:hypothetical protein